MKVTYMAAFLSEHLELVISLVVVCIFLIMLGRLLSRARKIERDGNEVWAVVSRVELERIPDGSDSYHVYVQYQDEKGTMRESKAGMYVVPEYEQGQRGRIRFLPGQYDMVRIMKDV